MKPSRAFLRLAPGVAAGALLAAMAGPVLAADVPKGSLRSREFAAPELAVSSSHVPLDDVLAELPNRAAWEHLRSERAAGAARAAGGAEGIHVFVDPRSGTATGIIAPFPLLPGDGVGNRVPLAVLSARLGREVAAVDAAVVAEAARLFVLEQAGLLGIAPAQLGTLRATQVSDTLWQVSAPQVFNGLTVRDARLALTISHGNVVAFGTEGWGTVVLRHRPQAAMATERAMAEALDTPAAASRATSYWRGRRSRSWPWRRPATRADQAYAGPVGRGYAHRLVYSMTFRRPPDEGRWETLVDAASGEVLAFRDKNQYENRQVTGGVYPLTNTGVCPTVEACGECSRAGPCLSPTLACPRPTT